MAANIGEIRGDAQTGVIGRVKDKAGKLTISVGGDVDSAIVSAVQEYEKQHPRVRAKRLVGAGDFKFQLDGGSPALPGFVEGSSEVKAAAYPHTTTGQEQPWLETGSFEVVRTDLGSGEALYLWFHGYTIAVGNHALLVYTTPHTLNVSSSSIPASDDEAIKDLAAAIACEQLAALYSQSTDGSVMADTVQHLSKAQEYRAMAKLFRESYKRKTQTTGYASAAATVGATNQGFGGAVATDYHFHGRGRF